MFPTEDNATYDKNCQTKTGLEESQSQIELKDFISDDSGLCLNTTIGDNRCGTDSSESRLNIATYPLEVNGEESDASDDELAPLLSHYNTV